MKSFSPRPRWSSRTSRSATGLVLALTCSVAVGCSSGEDPEAAPTPTASMPATGSPFGVEITGPETAETGDRVTATLLNTGRLPDAFQLLVEPPGAAVLSEQDVSLSPQESIEFTIRIKAKPFSVVVKSIGGSGQEVARLGVS